MNRRLPPGEVYLEYRPVGTQVRVTAIDATTGIEVVVFGPAKAAEEDLKRIAIRKLKRRISQGPETSQASDPTLY